MNLEQACSQVVAGQNYEIVATLTCPAPVSSSVQVSGQKRRQGAHKGACTARRGSGSWVPRLGAPEILSATTSACCAVEPLCPLLTATPPRPTGCSPQVEAVVYVPLPVYNEDPEVSSSSTQAAGAAL